MFKNTKRLFIGLSLATATMLSPHAFAAKVGTSVQHFTFTTAMTPTGIDADANGSVSGAITRQGNSFIQSLKVSVAHLDSNTVYQVTAFLGDDTNEVAVGEFTTDAKGAFNAAYMDKSQGKSPNGKQLPGVLNPLCAVRELHIFDGNTNKVLGAVLSNPDKGQYLVQRSMNNTGIIPAAAGT